MNRLEELSKEISYALRHAPWEYELEMDEGGWVPIAQLLGALHKAKKWKNICEADLNEMIERSEKKRHEIKDGKIRAFYGHSIPMKILKEVKMPPDILYHGTARRFEQSIMENGLLPQSRQYVHLSQDVETAVHLKLIFCSGIVLSVYLRITCESAAHSEAVSKLRKCRRIFFYMFDSLRSGTYD